MTRNYWKLQLLRPEETACFFGGGGGGSVCAWVCVCVYCNATMESVDYRIFAMSWIVANPMLYPCWGLLCLCSLSRVKQRQSCVTREGKGRDGREFSLQWVLAAWNNFLILLLHLQGLSPFFKDTGRMSRPAGQGQGKRRSWNQRA